LYCCTLLDVSCTAVHYWRSVVLLYITGGQLYCCTLLEVSCTALHYWRSVVLLYITGGQLYCCTLLEVSCTAVHYWRSVVLLYITGGQLYCCTLLEVSCTAVHYWRSVVLLYISCLFLYPLFIMHVWKETLKGSVSCLSVRKCHSDIDTCFLKIQSLTIQEIPQFLLNVSFLYHVQHTCRLFLSCGGLFHFTQYNLISSCSSVILFPICPQFFQVVCFRLWLQKPLCSFPYVPHDSSIQFFLISSTKYFWRAAYISKLPVT